MIMFTQSDQEQFLENRMTTEGILKQLEHFKKGFPPMKLIAPATPGNGIIHFNDHEIQELSAEFDKYASLKTILKFVPASGAASRMFKSLQSFRNKNLGPALQQEELLKDGSFDSVQNFMANLPEFAFFIHLMEIMDQQGLKLDKLDLNELIDHILSQNGLNYSNLPKALLLFHKYPEGNRTSLEEQLVEAASYATSTDSKARIHFTFSPEHLGKFHELISRKLDFYENKFQIKFEISHSIQNPSTNTIAVDMQNEPFRDSDGSILFRPGGHGALIDNLDHLDADLIFIKNIDNVVPDRLKNTTILYKKALGAYLLNIQQQVFNYLRELDSSNPDNNLLTEIEEFITEKLMYRIPVGIEDKDKTILLSNILDRPMRVCGMVKNEGEPGGGPFWAENSDGSVSLQIVESSQVDTTNEKQLEILKSSTHFNPVDLVCATKDYKGKKFDLNDFVDNETGFISIKSRDGKELKALELPGLWNGAMAYWNTIFVEVPLITFNPVKTINDLLRKEHLDL